MDNMALRSAAGYLEDIAGSLAAIADRLESLEYHLKRYVDLDEFWKGTDPSWGRQARSPEGSIFDSLGHSPVDASVDAGGGPEK